MVFLQIFIIVILAGFVTWFTIDTIVAVVKKIKSKRNKQEEETTKDKTE